MTDPETIPNDLLAEQSALGAMMLNEKALAQVSEALKPEDFYRPAHATIFTAIIATWLCGIDVDPVTVAAELDKMGKLKNIGGAPYLHTLMSAVPTPEYGVQYAQIVAGKARLRRLGELGVRLRQLASNDTPIEDMDAVVAQAEKFFRETQQSDKSAQDFDQLVTSWNAWYEGEAGKAIPTPWPALNNVLSGGLQRGRVYVVAARPGVGKSVATTQLARHVAFYNYKSVVISLEMSANEVMTRILAQGADVNLTDLTRRNLDIESSERVAKFTKENEGLPLQIVDRESITVEQIVAHCRAAGPFDVIVVDYLQLIEPSDKRVSRQEQVSHFSRTLKMAARELNAAVVVAAQLNRGPVKDGKPRAPTIADLRESGAIEQDSDCVILLHTNEDDPGFVQMIVGKNRQGKLGDLVMQFEGNYARITQ
ncbi:replicative DNA helicase [Mycobacteroides abscessus subsp. abscessus]|uniref:replicative DNA helicase n=1 Tax=Mycobacteroides abscessus TaxID=36809 RepID=UPI00092BAB43|nr:DnaB family ATPase [Mycobacteroides abscessus]UVK63449.1 DnaB-like dsDNA helicase [Mycobacterium phage Baudelaire]WKW86567.1 DnaB-like dsDNA helicase [Mycobacterium phage Aegeus]SIL73477.1 replicative DNA helicase [Mycobacteroides abscessus subsp. abscessus]